MYAKVENGQVTVGIPDSGTRNGSTVSGYNLLPEPVLRQEGWLPYREQKPPYDGETQMLEFVEHQITEEEIIAIYEVVAKPEEPLTIEDRVEITEATIGEILETIIPSIIGG